MHLKNFAMIHTPSGLRLSPVYDQVAAALYGYTQLALAIDNTENLIITKILPENIIALGKDFGLNHQAIHMAIRTLENNYGAAKHAVMSAKFASKALKQPLMELMDTLWNNTFASIGKLLSQKP